ncbi:hypothetical protein BUALT_Bualt08G0003800 [Buddleja alternifolia]|uniref:AT-rich interactive domain-containing protein 5 n=1 Tax=Buddleja alternifolia TaxID=168488 RepID=A0AAV6X2N1_9LAMI|nr:hypothetical protein BUALT_Bualt08G0003800 [Buddleja alternifolia]
MSKSDTEVEDAEKHAHDPVNNIKSNGEKFPSAASVEGDANKSEKMGEDLNKVSNEAVDKTTVECQTNEHKNADGLTREQVDPKSKNEELSNTITNTEEQTASRSSEEKQTDANNEVVEQNGTSGGVKDEKSTENVMAGENVIGEKTSGDVAKRKPEEIGRADADCVEHVAGEEKKMENADTMNDPMENTQLPTQLSVNEAPPSQNAVIDGVRQGEDEEMEDAANVNEDKAVKDQPKEEIVLASPVPHVNATTLETLTKHEGNVSSLPKQLEAATPNALVRYSPAKAGDYSGETIKTGFTQATIPLIAEGDDGTPEDQAAFIKELVSFYRERSMDFKPPKFYGQPLNCLKLWRAVLRLGGYDRVTGSKLWRQIGESFHPPKTCTTVSWTFRIFYEKSLLEYERHKRQSGELQLPVELPEASDIDNEGNEYQGSGSGRVRRDAAARAMQGWHVQRLFGNGGVSEPIIKDKNVNNMTKRGENLKGIGSLKQKRPNEVEHSVKAARTETSKQLVTSVIDVGPPADWVKINVRQTEDSFEVYALVPGLLREEVRVQSDPAGRLVITGQPEQVDNPWGVTPFKKVVSLPARIDPRHTSAVVSLHGRLFVRVPFERSNI